MLKHLFLVALMLATISVTTPQASAQNPRITVLYSIQPSDGITQAQMDQAFLFRFQEYSKERHLENLRLAIEAKGKRMPPGFDLHPESFYIVVGNKKFAASRFTIADSYSQIDILGIVGTKMHRIGCHHQSRNNVPLGWGMCADKVNQVFGVDLLRGFTVEHLDAPTN